MARSLFGLGVGDYVVTIGAGNAAVLAAGATLVAYNAQAGGTAYTDITSDAAGTVPVVSWLSGDGTGGTTLGRPAPVYGPDGVRSWWVSAGGGPRVLMVCADLADSVTSTQIVVGQMQQQLTSHLTAVNPHATRFEDLADWVTGATPTDGQVAVYSAALGKWQPGAGGGGGGGVSLSGGSTIQTPNGNISTPGWRGRIAAGDRTGGVNWIEVQWNAGSDSVPNYVTVFALDPYGQVRLRPAAVGQVASRTSRFSALQTVHLDEWTDENGAPLSWVEANGAIRGPNLGMVLPFSLSGTVATAAGKHRLYNDTGVSLTIRAVRVSVGTAPTGASLIVDVNKGGTSIFSTQSNRPAVAASANTSGRVTAINTTALGDGEYLTVDVDQVGSTVAGADMTVQILAY